MDITSFMKDGMIENWSVFEKVLEYAYDNVVKSEPNDHPVLFSEASWNQKGKREQVRGEQEESGSH